MTRPAAPAPLLPGGAPSIERRWCNCGTYLVPVGGSFAPRAGDFHTEKKCEWLLPDPPALEANATAEPVQRDLFRATQEDGR